MHWDCAVHAVNSEVLWPSACEAHPLGSTAALSYAHPWAHRWQFSLDTSPIQTLRKQWWSLLNFIELDHTRITSTTPLHTAHLTLHRLKHSQIPSTCHVRLPHRNACNVNVRLGQFELQPHTHTRAMENKQMLLKIFCLSIKYVPIQQSGTHKINTDIYTQDSSTTRDGSTIIFAPCEHVQMQFMTAAQTNWTHTLPLPLILIIVGEVYQQDICGSTQLQYLQIIPKSIHSQSTPGIHNSCNDITITHHHRYDHQVFNCKARTAVQNK